MIYLTRELVEEILKNRHRKNIRVSLDLGRTFEEILIEGDCIILRNGERISFELFNRIKRDRIYIYHDGKLLELSISDENYYKLVPTEDYPTIEINGIKMHRTKGITPKRDTEMKLSKIKIKGIVLDTCFGLGYTAIHASRRARFVISCEIDDNVLRLARLNPYSREAFLRKNIQIIKGDIFHVIKGIRDESIDTIIHDPPRFSLAGELYSKEFYMEMYRILKPGGMLFHYVGEPGIHRGVNIRKGVINRLREVGFKRIKWHDDVKGITAIRI